MPVTGINHITLKVRNLSQARRFYELLGFRESGQRERMVFLTLGEHHHHIALYEMGSGLEPAPVRSTGMAHFSVTVSEEAELGELYSRLTAEGYEVVQVVDHITNRGFYVRDGDGTVVEITYDAPRGEWAGMENPFGEDRPYVIPGQEPRGQEG